MKSKYEVEKRMADEHFIYTIPGIDYQIGDTYYVLKKEGMIVGWSSTEEGAWSCKR
jgi:hypothetical protein